MHLTKTACAHIYHTHLYSDTLTLCLSKEQPPSPRILPPPPPSQSVTNRWPETAWHHSWSGGWPWGDAPLPPTGWLLSEAPSPSALCPHLQHKAAWIILQWMLSWPVVPLYPTDWLSWWQMTASWLFRENQRWRKDEEVIIIHSHTQRCNHSHKSVHTCALTHTHTNTYTHIQVRTCTYTRMQACMHTHRHTHFFSLSTPPSLNRITGMFHIPEAQSVAAWVIVGRRLVRSSRQRRTVARCWRSADSWMACRARCVTTFTLACNWDTSPARLSVPSA